MTYPIKPLGKKAYGSIPHLPGSRRGPGDRGVNDGQLRICTERTRDRNDRVIIQEKLDGACVAVAKINGNIVPLSRNGFVTTTSFFEQHQLFGSWVMYSNWHRFNGLLREGERVVGEWLAQAHGTRYHLMHEPFVPFDIMAGDIRLPYDVFAARVDAAEFTKPHVITLRSPMSIEQADALLGEHGWHGALDAAEGLIYRVERHGAVDFLAKYVRPGKVDGSYLEVTGGTPHWNWRPEA